MRAETSFLLATQTFKMLRLFQPLQRWQILLILQLLTQPFLPCLLLPTTSMSVASLQPLAQNQEVGWLNWTSTMVWRLLGIRIPMVSYARFLLLQPNRLWAGIL